MAVASGVVDQIILREVSFVRPYVIVELSAGHMRATNLLRYTRWDTDTSEIAIQRGDAEKINVAHAIGMKKSRTGIS